MTRIEKLRKAKGISAVKAAEDIGIKYRTYYNYEKGLREPSLDTLILIARYFDVSIDYLLGRSDTPDIPNIISFPQMKKVPLMGTIACGDPIFAEENIETYINMPDTVKGSFALRCKGDSMINARIFDGDIVFIRSQPEVENGEIAAVLIDDEATLKRVYYHKDRIELRADNPTFPSLNYEGERLDEIRILGKAVGFLSTII